MNFKSTTIRILVITFVLIHFGSSTANNKPETLKEYFDSFARGKKTSSQDSWVSPDKGYHIAGSMIGTTLIGQMSVRRFDKSVKESQIIGASSTFALGVIKEFFDAGKPNNIFSWKDLAANGVGIVIGIILLGIK